MTKSRGAAGVPSEDKETEVKTGVRFPNQTPFCEVFIVRISNCAMIKITLLATSHSRESLAG